MGTVDWRRFGFDSERLSREALDARLRQTAAEVVARLVGEGRRHPGARLPEMALPPDFGALLERALDLEAREQGEGWEGRVSVLLTHYLEIMPGLRVEQVLTSDEPQAALFHTPLDWSRLPRLRGGIARFFALVEAAGVSRERAFGSPTPEAFAEARPTLADLYAGTYFAGVMPIVYGMPPDLAAYAAELDAGEDLHAVIDRWLAAPIVHELSHLSRHRQPLSPPYLDECVAGFLGCCALPSLELPARGERGGLFMAPWFAQVGRAIAGVLGIGAVIRAHAGLVPWAEVLPDGLGAVWEALGWDAYVATRGVHFLGEAFCPDPWLKALFLAAAGALPERADAATLEAIPWAEVPTGDPDDGDVERLAAALHATCLEPVLAEQTWRVRCGDARAPVIVDADACEVRVSGPKHPLEPAPLRVLCPPPIAARLRSDGVSRIEITPLPVEAVGDVANAISAGRLPADGDGWSAKATAR